MRSLGTKKKVQAKEEYKKQKFIKSGKPYYRVPDECVLGKEKNRCAFCKGELITKKVPVMLYNKEREMTSILSVELPFCEQCYVPFCSRDKYNLLRGKGLYVETFGYIKHSGQRLWTVMTEPQTKLASRFVLRKDYYEKFGLNDSTSSKMNLERPKNFWVEDKKIYLVDSYLHECVDERVGTPSRYQCVLMNYKSEYEKVDALYCPRCKKLLLKNNLYKNVKEHFPKYNFVDNTKIIEKNIVKAQEEHIITANMLMVCTDVKSCVKKGHQLKDIIALVDVVTPDIEIVKIRIPAGYCKQCNRYFLLEDEYASLSEKASCIL